MNCEKCFFVTCLSCKYVDTCPKNIFSDTIACEIFKLNMAMNEVEQPFKEEIMKFKPSKRTINTLVYILAFIFGVIITLAFQGKL